jgi:hypothetical protein
LKNVLNGKISRILKKIQHQSNKIKIMINYLNIIILVLLKSIVYQIEEVIHNKLRVIKLILI